MQKGTKTHWVCIFRIFWQAKVMESVFHVIRLSELEKHLNKLLFAIKGLTSWLARVKILKK